MGNVPVLCVAEKIPGFFEKSRIRPGNTLNREVVPRTAIRVICASEGLRYSPLSDDSHVREACGQILLCDEVKPFCSKCLLF
jgi:hypothetical protein